MKCFIVVDMEGATGVVHRDQLMAEGRGYSAAQKLLTADVNAVIEGVLAEDPTSTFVVGDGHGTMRNVLLEELHPSAELVIGPGTAQNKPLCQVEGIDDTFDFAIMMGFHTKAGTPNGLLAHTFVGSTICSMHMHGREVGEAEVDNAVLASFGVPTRLVIGNSDLEPEIRTWNPELLFASTKRTLGSTAAICKPPAATRQLIMAASSEAVCVHRAQPKMQPLVQPTSFVVETYRREMTDKACTVEGINRISDRHFEARSANAADEFRLFWKAIVRTQDEPAAWLQ